MLLDSQVNRSIVDCLRAVAILLVISFHVVVGLTTLVDDVGISQYVEAMPTALNILWQALGSEIIFLFSGFLLSYLLLRERIKTGRIDVAAFYVRRLSRIVPLYLVAIALYSPMRDFSVTDLIYNLLFVSKLADARTIVPVGWSLELLMQAYAVLPLLVLLLLRSRYPLVISMILVAASLALRWWAFSSDPVSYTTPIHSLFAGADATPTQESAYLLLPYRATSFLLGYVLAHITTYWDEKLAVWLASPVIAAFTLALGLAIVAVSGFLPVHDAESFLYRLAGERFWLWFWTLQRFVFSIGLGLVALTLWYGRSGLLDALRRVACFRIWKTVSYNIYSIYLFHPVFLIPSAVIAFRTIDKSSIVPIHVVEVLATILITATASTLFAMLTTRFIEQPAQSYLRARYSPRLRS